jgi:LL-diaminopimelate aminotransferase
MTLAPARARAFARFVCLYFLATQKKSLSNIRAMKRNCHIASLKGNYLFPEITARKNIFLEKNPHAKLISLGIGDTTQPLPKPITDAIASYAIGLSSPSGYSGYGPERGNAKLRQRIASEIYHNALSVDDIFVSDGAKCDLGRLQLLFGRDVTIAVQDPAYPVYVEGSALHGVKNIIYLPCTPENHFFPDLAPAAAADLIYFCSPNNPTGAAATHAELTTLVRFAREHGAIIIYDAAYANFIQDPTLPKSIYEIEGAQEVAIEVGSFSKLAGFTGVRLSWTVVPESLKYDDGSSVRADWNRLMSTVFNGASNIAQAGGYEVLTSEGKAAVAEVTAYYMQNARILKQAFQKLGYAVFGGDNAPYLWIRCQGEDSWDAFDRFLGEHHLVTTPGAGFGAAGEGFIRVTAFGSRDNILEAIARLT